MPLDFWMVYVALTDADLRTLRGPLPLLQPSLLTAVPKRSLSGGLPRSCTVEIAAAQPKEPPFLGGHVMCRSEQPAWEPGA
jgi:hypothetical protein